MPGFDGTGPRGKGPMTGKAQGYCLFEIADDARGADAGGVTLAGGSCAMNCDRHFLDSLPLRSRLRKMRMALDEMKSRLADLEAGGGK